MYTHNYGNCAHMYSICTNEYQHIMRTYCCCAFQQKLWAHASLSKSSVLFWSVFFTLSHVTARGCMCRVSRFAHSANRANTWRKHHQWSVPTTMSYRFEANGLDLDCRKLKSCTSAALASSSSSSSQISGLWKFWSMAQSKCMSLDQESQVFKQSRIVTEEGWNMMELVYDKKENL